MSHLAAVAEGVVDSGDGARATDTAHVVMRMLAAAPRVGGGGGGREGGNAPASSLVGAVTGRCLGAIAAAPHETSTAMPVVARTGSVVLAADATLIRRDELRAELRSAGAPPGDRASDGELLLAAWRAWGERMVEHVHGDIALVLVDAAAGVLFAWRDQVGRRPLYWAELPNGVAVASSLAAVMGHPGVPRRFNRTALAASAGALLEHPDETAWDAVRIVPPGHTLCRLPDSPPRLARVWHAPRFEAGPAVPFDEAVEELRRLMLLAVGDRLSAAGRTAVWLSGGWDSPAVYGAAVAQGGARVAPVSMSYPAGDRGREDETILAIAAHHGQEVTWASVNDVPLVEQDPVAEAASLDQPFVHPYRNWSRRLAAVTRETGASVALDGAGGDQLFGLTPVFLAELLRRGRPLSAAREAARHGVTGRSWRGSLLAWWMWGVRPLLSPGMLRAVGLLRGGRPPLGHLERPVPRWLQGNPGLREGLRQRARGWAPEPGESLGSAESRWYLGSPYAGRILAAQFEAALEQGVTLLSPLLDERVVRFAATRPREERAGGGETKRLLRAAASAWLPPELLKKRASRTGLSTDYFRRELRAHLPRLLTVTGDLEALEGFGVVSGREFREASTGWLAGTASDEIGLALLCTVRTELWVRARSGESGVDGAWGGGGGEV